jgi:hypothetical protein
MKALRFALLEGAGDILHRHDRLEGRTARIARLRLRHAGAAEGRIGIEVVGDDAIAEAAWVVVDDVGGDDLEVVIGGVGEGAPAVAVAERPDAGDAGAQLIVDLDEPSLVRGDAGLVKAEVVDVRAAAHGNQQMRADNLGFAALDSEAHRDVLAPLGDRHALHAQAQVDAFALQDVGDGHGNVPVLARDQPRCHLDDGHLAAEAAENLRKLEADVAAAEDE